MLLTCTILIVFDEGPAVNTGLDEEIPGSVAYRTNLGKDFCNDVEDAIATYYAIDRPTKVDLIIGLSFSVSERCCYQIFTNIST